MGKECANVLVVARLFIYIYIFVCCYIGGRVVDPECLGECVCMFVWFVYD